MTSLRIVCTAFCFFIPSLVLAQMATPYDPVITGGGSPMYIPQFVGTQTLGNSNIFQTGHHLGVNTTNPEATLDVKSADIFGILGDTSSTSAGATGVFGKTASASGKGVFGEATSRTGFTFGIYGQSVSPEGIGVYGSNTSNTGNAYGVFGQTSSTQFAAGVLGSATASTGTSYGVFGASSGTSGNGGFFYAGSTSGGTIGVSGFVESPTGTAGRFVANAGAGFVLMGVANNSNVVYNVDAQGNGFLSGNLEVNGNVSKGSGSFKIDHPLDPANKYLSHSFVESPDMMNVYNGVVVLNARGSAWIELPDYFQALNRDYRYQLTSIGAPGPNLYVVKEVSANRFRIAGGRPHAKVSWQVTGIRHDAYADAHRVVVEEDKPLAKRGQYLHPEVFRGPRSSIVASEISVADTARTQ
jgi:trimeric autotransporter adhesin